MRRREYTQSVLLRLSNENKSFIWWVCPKNFESFYLVNWELSLKVMTHGSDYRSCHNS